VPLCSRFLPCGMALRSGEATESPINEVAQLSLRGRLGHAPNSSGLGFRVTNCQPHPDLPSLNQTDCNFCQFALQPSPSNLLFDPSSDFGTVWSKPRKTEQNVLARIHYPAKLFLLLVMIRKRLRLSSGSFLRSWLCESDSPRVVLDSVTK
jgi:hypothetical protein